MDIKEFIRPTGLTEAELSSVGEEVAAGIRYERLRVRRRGGGTRLVLAPDQELKAILKLLRIRLQEAMAYEAPSMVFGYVQGRNIVQNAARHLGRDVVLSVDLKDFFGNVSSHRVDLALRDQGLSVDLVHLLLPIIMVENSLPPGFSTSPLLSNLIFESTDQALGALASSQGATYSRYADDLTFSGTGLGDSFLQDVECTLADKGWALNSKKTRFMRRGGPQYVTGLYVGDPERPHVPRRVKRWLRTLLHYISIYGYHDCEFYAQLPSVRQLEGWLRHVHQVNPDFIKRIAQDVDDDHLNQVLRFITSDRNAAPHDDWDEFLEELALRSN